MHLRQPHHHHAPALGDEGVGRLLGGCAGELGRGDVIVGLHRRAAGLRPGEARAGGDDERPVRAGQRLAQRLDDLAVVLAVLL